MVQINSVHRSERDTCETSAIVSILQRDPQLQSCRGQKADEAFLSAGMKIQRSPPPALVTLVRQQEGPGTKRSNCLRIVGEMMYHLPQRKTLLCVSAVLRIKYENHEVHESEMNIRERLRKAENF